ncbi:MAG: hypothetical protein ACI8QQ_003077 [Psychroserpens sp.]|jgi:hypothetical protein
MEERSFKSDFEQNDFHQDSEVSEVSESKRTTQKQKRVIVDFPGWMLESLDREANRVGVTRQSIIKLWLAERLTGESRAYEEKRKKNI